MGAVSWIRARTSSSSRAILPSAPGRRLWMSGTMRSSSRAPSIRLTSARSRCCVRCSARRSSASSWVEGKAQSFGAALNDEELNPFNADKECNTEAEIDFLNAIYEYINKNTSDLFDDFVKKHIENHTFLF